MLKLKNAVNSFVLTKKIFDKKKNKKKTRRMRGGMFTTQNTEQKLLYALKSAILNEYNNCLLGLKGALQSTSKITSQTIINKCRIHIPVVLNNLKAVKDILNQLESNKEKDISNASSRERFAKQIKGTKQRISTANTTLKIIKDIKKDIEEKVGYLKVQENSIKISGIQPELPELIKEIYTSERIKESSEVLKLLTLFDNTGKLKPFNDDSKIIQYSKEAKEKYASFLKEVSISEKSTPREKPRSIFSFGSKSVSKSDASTPPAPAPPPASGPPPASVSVNPPPVPKAVKPPPPKVAEAVKSGPSVGEREFSVTTKPGCNPKSCDVHITQKGGSRKSKRSKTLKGGRRRR